jgi:hypothetical protein
MRFLVTNLTVHNVDSEFAPDGQITRCAHVLAWHKDLRRGVAVSRGSGASDSQICSSSLAVRHRRVAPIVRRWPNSCS